MLVGALSSQSPLDQVIVVVHIPLVLEVDISKRFCALATVSTLEPCKLRLLEIPILGGELAYFEPLIHHQLLVLLSLLDGFLELSIEGN